MTARGRASISRLRSRETAFPVWSAVPSSVRRADQHTESDFRFAARSWLSPSLPDTRCRAGGTALHPPRFLGSDPRWIEAAVGIIVVALAALAEQDSTRTRFDLEIVIHILLDMDAFTRRELYLRPGRNGVGSAVAVDSHVGFFANGLVGQAVVDADEDIAAAVDDVLGLVPMEMIWEILSLFHVQQLLGVDLRIFVRHFTVAVADRDERHRLC